MEIRAYQEIYLNKAQSLLGDAFNYAVNQCGFSGNDFVNLFIVSPFSKQIENGDPSIISGKSGIELAMDIIFSATGKSPETYVGESFARSVEYWVGWSVAYYQWRSAKKFADIFKALPFDELAGMYYPLHEADITKFVEIVDKKIKDYFTDTNLKRLRNLYGCSQAELAKLSGVSLRSIQMYEQRNKDINKASSESLFKIAKVLGCNIEDLLEI